MAKEPVFKKQKINHPETTRTEVVDYSKLKPTELRDLIKHQINNDIDPLPARSPHERFINKSINL